VSAVDGDPDGRNHQATPARVLTPASHSPAPSRVLTLCAVGLLAAVSLGLWAWNLAHVPTLVNDDAFIYLRYAANWVDHGILAWNRGAVGGDGFTSFLYQVLVALTYRLGGHDVLSAAWYLSMTMGAVTVLLTLLLPFAVKPSAGSRTAATMGAAFASVCVSGALNPQLAYFTHSLMETTLVAFVVCAGSWAAAYLLTAGPRSRVLSILAGGTLGLLAMVRPEGLIVSLVVSMLIAVRALAARRPASALEPLFAPVERRRPGALALGLLAALLITGTYYSWHLERYHHPFPNPVYVKTAGVQGTSIRRGVQYMLRGPVGGTLPRGATRMTATSPAEHVDSTTVHAAITPDRSRLPSLALLALLPVLWLITSFERLFANRREAMMARHFLLVPTGWFLLVLIAGGDILHSGWRFVTPLLPALTVAVVVSVRLVKPATVAWLLGGVLAVLCARTVAVSFERPGLCHDAASACGSAAMRSWPPSLQDYEWDVSNAWQDNRLAAAIRHSFPTDAVIGQADFLRIGALLPEFEIADLSGLTDTELAHSIHNPQLRVFSSDVLVRVRPDIYIYGYRFISNESLATHHLEDPAVGRLLVPWPPRGSPGATQRLLALYRGASVALPDGTFFNFLVLRSAVPRMTSRRHIALGP